LTTGVVSHIKVPKDNSILEGLHFFSSFLLHLLSFSKMVGGNPNPKHHKSQM
jgi:hypothetical protein